MIYLDHAATTPMDKEVIHAMAPFYSRSFGNPSSLHRLGREAKKAVEDSRLIVAKILSCEPSEIIFTAGGTESDNLAIFGLLKQFENNAHKYHLITTNIEHPAVLHCFKDLEQRGFNVTYLNVDKFGLLDPGLVMKALRPNTLLVSIMYANNEIGTIMPISEIAKIVKNYRHIQFLDTISSGSIYPILHTDACQAAGYLNLKVDEIGVDLMTFNGSKIYGPKQTGILVARKNLKLSSLFFGGGQERNFRPGTENVAGIVGLAKAFYLADSQRKKEFKRLSVLRNYFIMELLKIPKTILNGHHEKRLPNNVNVSFMGIEGESITLRLDQNGIYVSTGSACHASNLEPSPVIMAIGNDAARAHSSIRFSFGRSTTRKDLEKTLRVVKKVVDELRKMSAIKS